MVTPPVVEDVVPDPSGWTTGEIDDEVDEDEYADELDENGEFDPNKFEDEDIDEVDGIIERAPYWRIKSTYFLYTSFTIIFTA